jgi:hypothetical protein
LATRRAGGGRLSVGRTCREFWFAGEHPGVNLGEGGFHPLESFGQIGALGSALDVDASP